jgi:hypothetical protein
MYKFSQRFWAKNNKKKVAKLKNGWMNLQWSETGFLPA